MLQQIEHMLDKYSDIIVQNWEDRNEQQKNSEMCDIYDSKIYQKLQAKSVDCILLPFTICTDGVKIFHSSRTSLWPIQMTQGYLPPNIRFLRENVLIVGLYCGNEKPDMSVIMLPLAKEMSMLKRKGIFMWRENSLIQFSPTVMFCSSDLPARAELQNCKTSSGYYGCPCCKQEGFCVKNPKTSRSYVRFLKLKEPAGLRTHEDAIKVRLDVMNGKELNDSQGSNLKSNREYRVLLRSKILTYRTDLLWTTCMA